jgi:hypothetical protein
MKTTSLRGALISLIAVACTAVPAFANKLTSATGNASCTQYTINVAGVNLFPNTANVSYKIVLTPTKGNPITILDTLTVTKGTGGNFTGTTTQNWSKYNLKLGSNYTISGAARLDVPLGNIIPIVFASTTLTCKIVVGSCLPTSSLSILAQGKTVTSYVPNGAWATTNTGVQVVPIEPIGTPASIATPNVVNSCSSNSTTGQTVCTANNTDVYLLTGKTLNTTLTSSSDVQTKFSGGYCENCGVAINSNTNTAVIAMGLSTAPSGTGLQFLNLATNTLATPIPATYQLSEDVLWDQIRNLLLSPDELGIYDIFQTSSGATEFANSVGFGAGDSAAEDCSTGIALSALEFSDQLYITDLTQAVYTSGTPGTWTAPQQVQTFPEFAGFSAGTSGIAVAGASHLGIVSGEFGGNQFAALQLPSSSGSGTPAVTDYAAAALPNTPDGNVWAQGWDPHTITAYVSPNNSKAYGVMANGSGVPPTYLALIDLQALLSAPRLTGTHTVDPTYDLIAHGVVVYIPVQ